MAKNKVIIKTKRRKKARPIGSVKVTIRVKRKK